MKDKQSYLQKKKGQNHKDRVTRKLYEGDEMTSYLLCDIIINQVIENIS